MGINVSGTCDLCKKKLDFDPHVIGTSPIKITIENVVFGNPKESIVCPQCWLIVKKALDNIEIE